MGGLVYGLEAMIHILARDIAVLRSEMIFNNKSDHLPFSPLNTHGSTPSS
jgi:hypothetical protein